MKTKHINVIFLLVSEIGVLLDHFYINAVKYTQADYYKLRFLVYLGHCIHGIMQ